MDSKAKIENCTSFQFCQDRFEVEWGVQLPDGRIVPVVLNGKLLIRFDQCLDLDKQIAYPSGVIVEGLRTLNDWVKAGGNAWSLGGKSGYRDDANGYHLFTPCGDNPLCFRLSTLDKRLDWQTTYIC